MLSRWFSSIILSVTGWGWVRRLFTGTGPGRRLALRFVAGESLEDALEAGRRLNAAGMKVSLDHLGEHVTDLAEAAAARDSYLKAIDSIAGERLDANISVKLTQLGLGLDDGAAAEALDAIAARAAEHGLTVTIDMEESAHTAATIDMFTASQRSHGNLGIALQTYLHRTPDDLAAVLPLGGHVRLCKGAYDEPGSVALRDGAEVDQAFDRLLIDLMRSPDTMPAIATHDEERISWTKTLARRRSESWEFQMLYGVRPALQEELVAEGYELRIYVPYGDSWYPYLTRRLAERPANLWFFVRALLGR